MKKRWGCNVGNVLGLALCAVITSVFTSVFAQGYPSKPIRLLVPFAPGGSTDIVARLLGIPVGHSLGQTLVVDNRPGSGGLIATQETARANPDGYTMILASGAQMGIGPALHARAGYDPVKDFVHVI